MVKKKNIAKIIILVTVVLILMGLIIFFVGRSYGFFQYIKKGDTTNIVSIKGIRTTIIEDDNALNLENAEPIYDTNGMESKAFTFSITNTSSRALTYTLKVANDTDKQNTCLINEGTEEETTCPVLSTDNIRFSYKLNDGAWSEPANLGDNNNAIHTYTINGKETLTYSIKIWIKSDATNEIMNHYFFGQLLIQGNQATQARCDISNPNSVAIWLACANVNKNYTTISEVLSDTTTLQILINNNDANDYLVASTDFATDIVANEDAMTYIGNNNYSADTLLANDTWLNAIANSSYIDSVLNISVPIMTSDTVPSGRSFQYGAESGYYAYMAFDGDDSTSYATVANQANVYVGYTFTSAKKIYLSKMLLATNTEAVSNYDYKIQGSNDGFVSDIHDLTSTFSASMEQHGTLWETQICDASSNYTSYRLISITPTVSRRFMVNTLQFYGREDVE